MMTATDFLFAYCVVGITAPFFLFWSVRWAVIGYRCGCRAVLETSKKERIVSNG